MAQCLNDQGPMKGTNVSGLVQVAGIMLLPSRGYGNESMIVWWIQSALCKKDWTLLMAKVGHWAWSCKSGIELPTSVDNALMFDVQTGSNLEDR